MKNIIFISLLIIACIFSWFALIGHFNNGFLENTNPACEWQTFETLGKVTEISTLDKNGKDLLSVKMKFNGSSLKNEPQYLEQLQSIDIDSAFIARNKIRVGLKYKFTVHEAILGNCESPVITFHHNLK